MGKIQYNDDDVFVDTTIGREAAGYWASAFEARVSFQSLLKKAGSPRPTPSRNRGGTHTISPIAPGGKALKGSYVGWTPSLSIL
jgi:hypothetical protein